MQFAPAIHGGTVCNSLSTITQKTKVFYRVLWHSSSKAVTQMQERPHLSSSSMQKLQALYTCSDADLCVVILFFASPIYLVIAVLLLINHVYAATCTPCHVAWQTYVLRAHNYTPILLLCCVFLACLCCVYIG